MPLIVRIGPGDNERVEFDYWPSRKRACLSLSSTQCLYASKHPDLWKLHEGDKLPTIPIPKLDIFNPTTQDILRKFNPTARIEKLPGIELVDGKRCRVYLNRGSGLVGRKPAIDSSLRIEERKWVWEQGDIVLQQELLNERLDKTGAVIEVNRTVTTTKSLILNPAIPASQFVLPPGTVCEIFGDYPVTLPPGVRAQVVPGSGIDWDHPL